MSARKSDTKTEHEAGETVADENLEAMVDEQDVPVAAEAEEPLQHRLLRLQADFDIFRKRVGRERGEIGARAVERLVEDLLPVIDHFEMGLTTARQHDTDQAVIDGLELVQSQLTAALKKVGLEPIGAEGQPFNPHVHEAVTHLPSEEHPADMIVAETRRGYQLGSKLLRASQVVVSSGSVEPEAEGDGQSTAEEESAS